MKHRYLFIISLFFCLTGVIAQDHESLTNQANEELKKKNYQRSAELATQALSKKITARAYLVRADSRYSLGDYQAAIDDYNAALANYSDYYGTDNREKAPTYYYRARCKQKLERYSDAIADFNTALSYNYDEPGFVYWNRGACYYNQGYYKEAANDYQSASTYLTDAADLSDIYKEWGDAQAKLGKMTDAYGMYAKAITYDPSNYNAYWQRGFYKDKEYKLEEALADYTKAIETLSGTSGANKNKNMATLYRNKALVLSDLGKYNEALTEVNQAIQYNPSYSDAFRTRGYVYEMLKNYQKSASDYENAITLQTDAKKKAEIYYARAYAYRSWLNNKGALEDLGKGLALNPDYGLLNWHRSIIYGYQKKYAEAIREVNTALTKYYDSSSKASLYWLRASHKDLSGDFTGAMEDYKTYLNYYPNSSNAYYELGRLFKTKMKNTDLAQLNFTRSEELARKNNDKSRLAYVLFFNDKKEEAIQLMQTEVQTSKDDKYNYKWNLHNLACLYSMSGNTAKGLEYLEKSLAAGFDDFQHLVYDRDLVNIMKQPQWKTILAKYKVPEVKN